VLNVTLIPCDSNPSFINDPSDPSFRGNRVYISPFWQQVIKGFLILLAVIIEKLSSKEEEQ
jgi:hypothetical protein